MRFAFRPLVPLFVCGVLLGSGRTQAAENDPWWGPDKKLHFGVSCGIAGASYLGTSFLTPKAHVRATASEMLAFSAGIAKEVYDKFNHGDPSFRDLTWDLIGSTTGTVVAWLIDRYLF